MDNEEIETEATSLWNKKQDDLTVGDSLKIGLGITAVATVAPILVLGIVSGACSLWEKFRNRKQDKIINEQVTILEERD